MTNPRWWRFFSYSAAPMYGVGIENDADEYCDILNVDREINVYTAFEMTNKEVETLKLADRRDTFVIGDALAAHKGLRMTGPELDDAIHELHLTRSAFARECGVDARAVYRWLRGELPVPQYAATIIRLMRDHLQPR